MYITFGVILSLQLSLIHGNSTDNPNSTNNPYPTNVPNSMNYPHSRYSPNSTRPPSRIVGGSDAHQGQFPYMVSLRTLFPEAHICGANIISENWVLSAGHCMFNVFTGAPRPARDFVIAAGDLYQRPLKQTTEIRFVKKVYIHPRYRHNWLGVTGDVALMKLVTPFKLSDNVKPIGLITHEVIPFTMCVVAGWGLTDAQSNEVSNHLLYIDIPLIDKKTCSKQLKFKLPRDTICAGEQSMGKDSCSGDSGGALVCDGAIAGVVSYGKIGCESPTVYSDVLYHAEWIQKVSSASRNYLSIACFLLLLISL